MVPRCRVPIHARAGKRREGRRALRTTPGVAAAAASEVAAKKHRQTEVRNLCLRCVERGRREQLVRGWNSILAQYAGAFNKSTANLGSSITGVVSILFQHGRDELMDKVEATKSHRE